MIDTREMVMPVAPAYSNGNNGLLGGDGAWIILLLLLGWGNNGNGFGGNGYGNIYPWMNQSNQISNGFQNAAMGDQITAIQSAINDLGVANLQQSFNVQTAMNQGFNGVQSQLANYCYENRLASADLKYTIATENCADRQAIADGIQKIMDKLCDQELQAERRENANLRTQLNMANLAASQTAQTAQILADNSRQTTALEQYLNPVPIPAYVVQNPNCCPQATCGCGSF